MILVSKDGRLKLSACQPYLEPKVCCRAFTWRKWQRQLLKPCYTPRFDATLPNSEFWILGDFFAAATEKPEHGEALGEALGHLFFWSGCEVGVNTCWWRMRELFVNTSPQILSLRLKYGSYACP